MMQDLTAEYLPLALAEANAQNDAQKSAKTAFLAASAAHLGLACQEASPVVRAAYWESEKDHQFGLYALSDALSALGIIACASRIQRRALFMLLPAAIVTAGIGQGFNNPAVRAAVFQYVENHRDFVRKAISKASGVNPSPEQHWNGAK